MAKTANLSKTVFGNDKANDLAVVDVYSETGSSDRVMTVFKSSVDETGSKVLDRVKNSQLTDLTKVIKSSDSGLSVDSKALNNRLEKVAGMKLDGTSAFNTAMRSKALGDITGLSKGDTSRLVDLSGTLMSLNKGNSFESASDYTNFVNELLGSDVAKGIADSSAEFALFGTLIGFAVGIGLDNAIDALLDKIHDSKKKREALINSVEAAAKAGNLSTLEKIRGYIGGPAMFAKCPNIVKYTLAGYSFPSSEDENVTTDYTGIYSKMVDLFNSFDANWTKRMWGSNNATKLDVFSTASDDSIKVFCNAAGSEYQIEAMIAGDYEKTGLKSLLSQQFPKVAITVK